MSTEGTEEVSAAVGEDNAADKDDSEIDLYGDVAAQAFPDDNAKEQATAGSAEDDEEDLFNIGEKSVLAESEAAAEKQPLDKADAAGKNRTPDAGAPAASYKPSYANHDGRGQRRHSCYVGNLTWWTTDLDVEKAVNNLDIEDLIEVRFHENRTNGQSKGFAVVSFKSDTSVRKCLESLSTQTINGLTPIVMPYSKQSLMSLESTSAKKTAGDRPPPRPLMADDKPPSPIFLGTVRLDSLISNAGRDAGRSNNRTSSYGRSRTSHLPSLLSSNVAIPMPSRGMPPMGTASLPPPVLMPPPIPNRPPPGYPMPARPPPMAALPPTAVPPPGSHINPNFYPGLAAASAHLSHYADPMTSDPEYEETLNRNRTVTSSAITRAVADAATGDFNSAIETLVTAMTLLRGSKVAHDERNRILISSLQDTLRGIEKQSYGSGRRSKQSRERSHPRDYRKRRSDRSRSRSRERHGIDGYSPRRKRY